VKLSLESLEREVRNLKRDIDRVSGGGLLVRQNLDMRKFRIVNLGNPETTSDAGTTATSTGTTTSTVTVTGGVAGPASSTVNAITTWGDSSGTTLLSGAAALTSAGALSGLTTISLSGQLTSTLATGTAPLVVASATQVANLYAARAALADTVTTNANLTGPITSVGNATAVAAQTGTGSTFVMQASPTLTTPVLGVATGTSLQLSGGGSVGADNRWYYGGVATGWNLRQNLSGNLVWADALTNELTLSTAALFPSTTGGLDLGLTGTRWGAGYFSGLVRASSLNLTLGGTELALATDEVAMFTSRAASTNDAWVAINSGSLGNAGLRFYDDGAENVRFTTSNAAGTAGVSITVAGADGTELSILGGASGFLLYEDDAGTDLFKLDHATNGAELFGLVTKYNNIATVSNGVPSIVAQINTTGHTANIAAADLLASGSVQTSYYRVIAYLKVTTAGSVSSTLPSVVIGYTDPTDSVAQSITMLLGSQAGVAITTNAGNSTTTVSQGTAVIHAKTGVAIRYSTTGYLSTAAGMTYKISLRLEQL
jgi:hypothetical protein